MLVIVGVVVVVVVVMIVLGGTDASDATQRRFGLGRHLARGQGVEQFVGGGGDGGDRPFERFASGVRWLLDAAHFAHVLTGSGLDLLVGGDGLQAAEGRDVPAHANDGSRSLRRLRRVSGCVRAGCAGAR